MRHQHSQSNDSEARMVNLLRLLVVLADIPETFNCHIRLPQIHSPVHVRPHADTVVALRDVDPFTEVGDDRADTGSLLYCVEGDGEIVV